MRFLTRNQKSLVVALALLPSLAGAFVIDFDDLTAGEVVTTQYAEATFSSSSGYENSTVDQDLGSSLPYFIGTSRVNGGYVFTAPTYVEFTSPVTGLSFLAIGANDEGNIADVDIYVDGVLTSTFEIVGDGTPLTPDLVDLTAFSNITRIEIYDLTDEFGLGWDDFTFEVVPEPTSAVVFGLAVIVFRRQRAPGKRPAAYREDKSLISDRRRA